MIHAIAGMILITTIAFCRPNVSVINPESRFPIGCTMNKMLAVIYVNKFSVIFQAVASGMYLTMMLDPLSYVMFRPDSNCCWFPSLTAPQSLVLPKSSPYSSSPNAGRYLIGTTRTITWNLNEKKNDNENIQTKSIQKKRWWWWWWFDWNKLVCFRFDLPEAIFDETSWLCAEHC